MPGPTTAANLRQLREGRADGWPTSEGCTLLIARTSLLAAGLVDFRPESKGATTEIKGRSPQTRIVPGFAENAPGQAIDACAGGDYPLTPICPTIPRQAGRGSP